MASFITPLPESLLIFLIPSLTPFLQSVSGSYWFCMQKYLDSDPFWCPPCKSKSTSPVTWTLTIVPKNALCSIRITSTTITIIITSTSNKTCSPPDPLENINQGMSFSYSEFSCLHSCCSLYLQSSSPTFFCGSLLHIIYIFTYISP